MATPWKKHRFSRFIANLRSPPIRGESLFIVETGFPASLVDLFIKTRYRLHKSSAKKRSHRGIGSSNASPPHHPPPVNSINDRCDNEVIEELSANSVVAVVAKSLVAVVLALSLKRLVVGITLSAFVLLLLEYVCKLVEVDRDLWLRPYCKSKKELNNGSNRLVLPEIGVRSVSETESRQGTKIEVQGADLGRSEDSNKRSRSRRIKTKIVNKWQALKKKIKSKSKRRELDHEEEQSSERSSQLSSAVHQDCIEKEVGPKINEESETRPSGRGTNSGCLVLILVVLVGLAGGRIWGFVLTLVWCLILQIVCVYKKRNID